MLLAMERTKKMRIMRYANCCLRQFLSVICCNAADLTCLLGVVMVILILGLRFSGFRCSAELMPIACRIVLISGQVGNAWGFSHLD